MRIARERYSVPEKEVQLKTSAVRYLRSRRACRFLQRISYMKELLPLPETPVMEVMTPSGTSTFKLSILKIFPPAMRNAPFFSRRFFGTPIFNSPRKYPSVRELLIFFLEVKTFSK